MVTWNASFSMVVGSVDVAQHTTALMVVSRQRGLRVATCSNQVPMPLTPKQPMNLEEVSHAVFLPHHILTSSQD